MPLTTLVALFESQVLQTPASAAVILGDQVVSYGELNDQANRLAHHLIGLGGGPECLVGVCLERSIELVVALLGILKSGGAYVPLDPSYPEARLAYMLADASPKVVITTQGLVEGLPSEVSTLVLDEAETVAALAQALEANPRDADRLGGLLPHHPAYVIYTSGSTGAPKGVIIDHRALSAFLSALSGPLTFGPDDHHLAVTTVAFDISIVELFLPLCHGAQVVVVSESDARDPAALCELIQRRQITSMQATPSHWQVLVEALPSDLAIRQVLSGGEALRVELGEALRRVGDEVYSLYGPTESTKWSILEQVSESVLMSSPSSIVGIASPGEG